ncbi:3-hydroxyacyl-CoA dehydrogenase [Acinetobacter sp. GSS19]|uniref:3-hydroxyacyl-CoA dehydrogenase n=1 Tax=Acinetobacter sp. GSS19 TaxID=3020716 RepID=UPI0023629FE1|nr:3-hydroxyacyl-CoA dehydrogenase [Acinetobacter sp. GSS19]
MQYKIQQIGIIGAGIMGTGIAQIAILSGHDVYLYDANAEAATQAKDRLGQTLQQLASKGKFTEEQVITALTHLHVAEQLLELKDCQLVIEAIIEKLDIKQQLMQQLESIVSPQTILATNTSSLSVTAIAAHCHNPERVAGFHFFNPVPLMKVVEVIQGLHTQPEVLDHLTQLAQHMGHRPVRTKDTPGFIINHAGRAYLTESLKILGENVASVEQIDQVLKSALGFRMGPFELLDLTGLDVSHPVMESIYQQYYQEPRYRPSILTQQMLTGKRLGRKTGQGFYRYVDQQKQTATSAEPDFSYAGPLPKVWLSTDFTQDKALLSEYLTVKGIQLDTAEHPATDSLVVIASYGEDATSSALRLGVNPQQVVCLDLIAGFSQQRTLMPSLLTNAEMKQAAQCIFQDEMSQVTWIAESIGLISQRVLAMIVNLGCDMAQQGIATVEDINAAVRLGLGYPHGPIEWGDFIGADKVLLTLERMLALTGDPRYRPSPWLQRRCKLKLPLTFNS